MNTDWVGGVKKGQNLDYVIFEWSHSINEIASDREEEGTKIELGKQQLWMIPK